MTPAPRDESSDVSLNSAGQPSLATPTRAGELHISAFGIHTGGGLVLLETLLAAAKGRLSSALIDTRLATASLVEPTKCRYVRRSFIARFMALVRLSREAEPGNVLLCFNSLPPPVRSHARVVTFVHAPYLVGLHKNIKYTASTALRIAIENAWFSYSARYSDVFWVQTPSMAVALAKRYPKATVEVVPLVDETLAAQLQRSRQAAPTAVQVRDDASFFYPADAVAHKNHVTLLLAWKWLARAGHTPRLHLTLRAEEWERVWRLARIQPGQMPNVSNLGRLSRTEVLERMKRSSAVVFPSMAETFGLPMLEARSLGVPVIAAECDFVRDVCVPAQSFDPRSARSIADAVTRFLKLPSAATDLQGVTAYSFLNKLVDDDSLLSTHRRKQP